MLNVSARIQPFASKCVKLQKRSSRSQASAMSSDSVDYLRSLVSVRDGCHRVYALAKDQDALPHFHVDSAKLPALADYVIAIIREKYAADESAVPFHSRYVALYVAGYRADRFITRLLCWL